MCNINKYIEIRVIQKIGNVLITESFVKGEGLGKEVWKLITE